MLKRYATLMLGVVLVGLGVLFFAMPERAYVLQVLVRFWPLFLILAGVVRVAGHLIDRHPRSPVGGLMLTSFGGILLAANLNGDRTFIHIFGRYWFWLLLALIAGQVIRQYTYRHEDGPRPRTFGIGTVLLSILIVGGGLAANILSNNAQLLSRLNLRLGRLTEVRDYVFGDKLAVDDEPAQTFALQPNARLVIGDVFGDIEIKSGTQPLASAKLVKHVRAASEDEAREAAKHIRLQIAQNGNLYQISVNPGTSEAGQIADFSTSLVIELPAAASIEVQNPVGQVKLSNLRGDHTINNGDRIDVFNNAGRVVINNPRGAVQLKQIQGEVIVTGARREVTLREIVGNVSLEAQDGTAHIEQIVGLVKARVNNTRLEIREVQNSSATGAAEPLVNLDNSSNSRISVRDISGSVAIAALNSRLEADAINGNLTIGASSERVHVSRIVGLLRLNAEGGSVEAEELQSGAAIEAMRDVTVRNFRGPLNVTTRLGAIRLSTDAQLGGDVHASSQHGLVRVSLPPGSGFRLDASTTFGKLRLRGFDGLELSRNQKAALFTSPNGGPTAPLLYLRSVNGEIRLEPSGVALAAHEIAR